MVYAIPIILVVAIGLLSGVMLTVASKVMYVPVDERVLLIREALPGANCGACGYAGCDDYAEALAADPTVPTNACPPGGETTAMELADILGIEYAGAVKKFAIVKCAGTSENTSNVMDYQGWQSCAGSKSFYRGRGWCDNGCLALGDCERVCEYDAIRMENGVAVIDKDKCIGCGVCVKACPNNLIDVVYDRTRVYVSCMTDKPAKYTRDVCEVGCIACGLCVKACKFDAITIENNHAVIDYEKCKNCGLCAKACPRDTIIVLPKPPKAAKKPVAKAVDAPADEKPAAKAADAPKEKTEKPDKPTAAKEEKPSEQAEA